MIENLQLWLTYDGSILKKVKESSFTTSICILLQPSFTTSNCICLQDSKMLSKNLFYAYPEIIKFHWGILSNSSNPFSILPHFAYMSTTFCQTVQAPFSILPHFVYMFDMAFTMRTFDKVHIGLNLYGYSFLVLKHSFLHRVKGYWKNLG